jgi:hypothetical protein
MPLINAQGETFREWEGLIAACNAHVGLLPNVEEFRDALQGILTEAREMKARQEEFEGRRQWATQQLGELIEQGRETVRRLRGYTKAHLGTKNELLVQFGAAPIRRRVRSASKSSEKGPTPPPPVDPGVNPSAA